MMIQILGLSGFISIESILGSRQTLLSFVEQNYILSIVLFFAVYVTTVTFSLPGSQVLTITAGFMFGSSLGATLSVAGATVGAALLFLAVTRIFGFLTFGRPGSLVEKLASTLKADAWSYLFVLRLVPVAPFFAVNLAAALVGVSFRTFALTTFFGIMPGSLAYATFGDGLGTVFQAGSVPGFFDLMTPELLLSTSVLTTLAIAAIPLRRYVEKRMKDRPTGG